MLAAEQNSTIWIEDDIPKLVDFLLRYTYGQEYTESELQTAIAIPHMPDFPMADIEERFLANHVETVRSQCVMVFADPTNLTNWNMDKLIAQLFTLWKELVLPDNLVELEIITSEGQNLLRVVYATIVRAFVDIPELVSWLAKDENVHHIQEVCKIGLDEEANAVLAQVIPLKIDQYINSTWKHKYIPNIPMEVENWVHSTLIPEIQQVLSLQQGQKATLPISQITELATDSLARLRIRELYDIVNDGYSLGLEDLTHALVDKPDLREETVQTFTKQCQQRLLNGASDTVEIIQMLLRTVYAFSILDPQGVLLEKVSKPIRAMLKERPDTSVKLAEGLFGDTNSSLCFLFDDLRKQAKPQTNASVLEAFEKWVPDPIDTPVDFVRKQTQDSVSTLIDLYDNKEVFIKQFVTLFGAELLERPFDRETSVPRLIDLFKLLGARFGISNMQKIAVMLEDVQRSDFVNKEIQKHADSKISHGKANMETVSPLILSRLYWPNLTQKVSRSYGSPNVLPTRFKTLLEEYMNNFNEQPNFETLELQWLPNKGRVRIELTLADRNLDMVVEPFEAVLISAFSDDSSDSTIQDDASLSLTLAELSEKTNLDEPQLLAAIQFWVDHGVLGTDGEKYKVLETSEEVEEQRKVPNQVVSSVDVSSAAASTASAKQAKDMLEEMHVYWSYIVGMLTNLGALPLDRIHSFLVMFVPNEDPYVKTKQELESYLLAMVDDDKLKLEDGKYSLMKK